MYFFIIAIIAGLEIDARPSVMPLNPRLPAVKLEEYKQKPLPLEPNDQK